MPHALLLTLAGLAIGVFSVVVGGGLFVSIPLLQALCPAAPVGALVGNLKVGSFFRSLGSTLSTHKQIDYLQTLKLAPIAFLGTIAGASLIADLNQKWLLPAITFAIIFTLLAPRLAPKITNKTFLLATFLAGIYAGILGAGIGVILVALLRLKHPKDTDIAFVKIQARFFEFLLLITAVATHFFNHNLLASLWIPLSLGGLLGGFCGGLLLKKVGELHGNMQKYILYAAFAVDLAVAGYKFFA